MTIINAKNSAVVVTDLEWCRCYQLRSGVVVSKGGVVVTDLKYGVVVTRKARKYFS